MNIIDRPQFGPGCDFYSGTDIGPFLDLNLHTDQLRNGFVYVSKSTCEQFGKQFGMASAAEAASLRDQVAELAGEKAALEAKVASLTAAVDGLVAANYAPPAQKKAAAK